MIYYKRILSAAVLAVLSGPVDALPFSVEARSLGMGNARVATADIATAPFANPAMLSFQPSRKDFSLLIGVGGFLSDNDGVVDKIDDFQSAFDSFQATANINDGNRALSIAQSLDGNIIAPELTAAFATGYSREKWAFAVSARADAISAGTVTDVSTTLLELNDLTKNILVLEGVLTTELGLSVASSFQLWGQKMAVGLKPKYVKIDNVFLSESISTIDTSLSDFLDDKNRTDLGDYTTIDVGVVMELTKSTQIGLVVTNLASHKVDFINSSGNPATFSFDTQARLGVAFRNDYLTLGADIDLIETDALLTSQNFQALKSQYVSLGGEFNAFEFMQLRIGAQKNIADGISEAAKDNLYTAGIGFWFGFSIDLAVVTQNDSLGGFLQTGFRF